MKGVTGVTGCFSCFCVCDVIPIAVGPFLACDDKVVQATAGYPPAFPPPTPAAPSLPVSLQVAYNPLYALLTSEFAISDLGRFIRAAHP